MIYSLGYILNHVLIKEKTPEPKTGPEGFSIQPLKAGVKATSLRLDRIRLVSVITNIQMILVRLEMNVAGIEIKRPSEEVIY